VVIDSFVIDSMVIGSLSHWLSVH